MTDRGEFLGMGYVERMGPVQIFHDQRRPERLIVNPTKYDGGETSLLRKHVRFDKPKVKTE